ncbi:MAG: CoA pyrophosphatase [Deltaproteobacteria bacterium]|nr:CoA pyrophosphatase [Deltaproteobacteria bacterium]MBI3390094.1 CoA pyrophosphatase [Deltaproteobacteria bacterium]
MNQPAMTRAATRAAVLVPLCVIDGEDHVVFILRSADAPVHPGDIAFPGGRYHAARDESLLATALREAEEEIGLRAGAVELLHALPEVRTLTSNFLVAPFVGRIPERYPFAPDPREVAAVLTIPLAQLRLPNATQLVRRHTTAGTEIDVRAFVVGAHVIWGATYRITVELLRVLAESGFRRS